MYALYQAIDRRLQVVLSQWIPAEGPEILQPGAGFIHRRAITVLKFQIPVYLPVLSRITGLDTTTLGWPAITVSKFIADLLTKGPGFFNVNSFDAYPVKMPGDRWLRAGVFFLSRSFQPVMQPLHLVSPR